MLTQEQKKRLDELVEKKKQTKLDDSEFKEFRELLKLSKNGAHKGTNGKKSPKGDHSFKPGNDLSWWVKIPELTRDSATFKSNYIPGTAIGGSRIPYVVPGVYAIELCTQYHCSVTQTDPVNVWARNTYLKMFQKYRPASGYSASDLAMAILAGLEAVKLIASYERIYGIINRYSIRNVNMPDTELKALNLTAAEIYYLKGHMSDFRYDLNYLIRKAQRLCIPKDITLCNDIISLLGYEYCDHDNPRAQFILFRLGEVGRYSDTDLTTGGSIKFNNIIADDWFDFSNENMCVLLDEVLDDLLGSDSIQRIFADLVVWFGQENMLTFLPMPEDYTIVPVKSDSILHKMHNMEQAPFDADGGMTVYYSWAANGLPTADENKVLVSKYIYQYNDTVVTAAVITSSGTGTPTNVTINGVPGKAIAGPKSVYGFEDAHIIDGYEVDPGYEFIVEGSLLKYGTESYAEGHGAVIATTVDWLVRYTYLFSADGNIFRIDLLQNDDDAKTFEAEGRVSLLDWAPISYNFSDTMGLNAQITYVAGDLDVVIPVMDPDLRRIQRTCFLSGVTTELVVTNK